MLLVFAAATYTRADPDLWGHLRFGLDTLASGTLPADDPYSFTQDVPWINHEWLSEAQMALAYHAAGPAGLAVLKGLLVFATVVLLWGAMRGATLMARIVTMAFVVFGTAHMISTVRPQVWTFLALAVLCRTLATGRPEVRRWLPLLFAIWANVHGGWVVGVGVMTVWAAADIVTDRAAVRAWRWLWPLSLAATLATPYGWRLWFFMLETVRLDRAIAEWQPTWAAGSRSWVPWVMAAGGCAYVVRFLPTRRLPTVAVLTVLGWASFEVARVGSLFVEAAVILLGPGIAARFPTRPTRTPTPASRYEPLAAAYLFALAVGAATWVASQSLTCIAVRGTWVAERAPVQVLVAAGRARLVTFFNWGEYAIWHLGPAIKVSMDGRRETVYSDTRLAEHDAIVSGTPEGLEALATWRAEYVWLPASSQATRAWLTGHGYHITFESERSFVAVRQDLPALPEPPGERLPTRCFPD